MVKNEDTRDRMMGAHDTMLKLTDILTALEFGSYTQSEHAINHTIAISLASRLLTQVKNLF